MIDHKFIFLEMITGTFTLKVAEIRRETEDAVTLCFKQPALKKIKYLAGQYMTLIMRINGRRYFRPYSFSSSPGVDTYLEVTVKRVPYGIVSNHINDAVQVGDAFEMLPAMGDFSINEDFSGKNIFLWGAGSGITPLVSIAKFALHRLPDVKVHLIYGNRNFETTIFLDQITNLKDLFQTRFEAIHFHTILTVEEGFPNIVQGRIDEEKALKILAEHQNFKDQTHYICGPFGLKESVKKALYTCGVSEEMVFSEDFEMVKNEEDFVDIQTRVIGLEYEGNTVNLEIIKGKSILEAALDAGIDLPYSCQTGNCSTCKGKLIAGEARMIGLKEARTDLSDDELLLCCLYPVNDKVLIKI